MGLTKSEKKAQKEAKRAEKRAIKIARITAKKEAKAAKVEAIEEKKANKHHDLLEKNRAKFMQKYFAKRINGAEDFDQLVESDYLEALKRAKALFGLEETQANSFSPLLVSLPEVFYPDAKLKIKMGKKHDHLRYNQSRVSVLLFDEKQLYYYTVLIDHFESLFSDDYGVEIPYEGIVSVETKSVRLFEKKSFHQFIDYQLFLVNDHSITIRLKDIIKQQKELQKGADIPEDTLKILNGISRFLREKRGL